MSTSRSASLKEPVVLNFGQRKKAGELFSSSAKSFHNLRKAVMPSIQKILLEALDEKHHSEWLKVLELLVQQMQQLSSGDPSSIDTKVARKNLSVDHFKGLLIVRNAAELFLNATSSDTRDALTYLFMGSLSHAETNELLEDTSNIDTKINEKSDERNTVAISETQPKANSSESHSSVTYSSSRKTNNENTDVLISLVKWKKLKKLPVKSFACEKKHSPHANFTNKNSASLSDTKLSEECNIPLSVGRHKAKNSHGRLGYSAEAFSRTAIVRRIAKAYHCAPTKEQKEDLLSLCIGSFTRQEVNKYVVKPIHSGRKRNFDQVSKVWWRRVRCLAEADECSSTSLFEKGAFRSMPPTKRLRSNLSDDSLPAKNKSVHFNFANRLDILPTARDYFLRGGLSMLSSSFSDSLLQSVYHQRDRVFDEAKNDDNDKNDDNINEGSACSSEDGYDNYVHEEDFEDENGIDDEADQGTEDENDNMSAYMDEDEAIFDFDE